MSISAKVWAKRQINKAVRREGRREIGRELAAWEEEVLAMLEDWERNYEEDMENERRINDLLADIDRMFPPTESEGQACTVVASV